MSRLLDATAYHGGGLKAQVAIAWTEVQAVEHSSVGITQVKLYGGQTVSILMPFGEARALFAAYLHDYASKP